MSIFAIGDLHLPGGGNKPMDIFGAHWEGHFEKICRDWRARVGEEDVVLIPGDISWAMQMDDALKDLRAIGQLPGKKILRRGNHDYWWSSITKLRDSLPEGMHAIQNDALRVEHVTVAGTRGWTLPGTGGSAEDERIYQRELMRMALSLDSAKKLGGPLVVMTHFPPLGESGEMTEAARLITEAGAKACVYGHLHGSSGRSAFNGMLGDTLFACVSCDQLDFKLYELPDLNDVSGA